MHLDWVGVATTLVGMWLLAQKRPSAWLVLIFGNMAWIIHFTGYPNEVTTPPQYAAIVLNVALGAISLYGWVKWKQARRAEAIASGLALFEKHVLPTMRTVPGCPERKTNHFYDEYGRHPDTCVYCSEERPSPDDSHEIRL